MYRTSASGFACCTWLLSCRHVHLCLYCLVTPPAAAMCKRWALEWCGAHSHPTSAAARMQPR